MPELALWPACKGAIFSNNVKDRLQGIKQYKGVERKGVLDTEKREKMDKLEETERGSTSRGG